MDVIIFTERVKHGSLDFHPGPKYGFEDPDAAPYFKTCGWAEDASGEPALVISVDELDIDPLTVWGNGERRGKFVMPERAAEKLGVPVDQIREYVATFVPAEDIAAQIEADLKENAGG